MEDQHLNMTRKIRNDRNRKEFIAMEITRKSERSKLTLSVDGRVDTKTAPELEEAVQNLDGVEMLILDLAKVSYISSAGLRVLLIAQKTMNKQGEMIVKNVAPDVMEIFEVTGFTDLLNIR